MHSNRAELSAFESDIKAAFKRAVDRAGGCVKVAHDLGAAPSLISRYGNPDDPSFPPAHILQAVDHLAAEPICLTVMAAEWGLSLMPTSAPIDKPCVMTAVAEVCKTAGDLQSVTLRAAADGRLSNNEKAQIRDKIAGASSAQRLIAELTV